ncbi:MAG: phosphatase PAP2 family protein [Tannerella sp.]|jgi:membrane-associated phospholipid phosphatase|nr:phosphatase PAP2 family protein [Tannerella sp.]
MINRKNIESKIRIIFVALCCPALLYSQEADTLGVVSEIITETDTVGIVTEVVETKTSFQKAREIAEITLPSLMVVYGVVSIENGALKELDSSTGNELSEDHLLLYHKIDDYMQYSPAAAAFVMNLAGVKSKHKLGEMALLYALSNGVMGGVVYPLKNTVERKRPDSFRQNSFPSGHTATAFAAAEFLHQEYGEQSPWISAGGFTMATLIGFSRVFNNRHWVSDVVAGAGIGILSTKLVYWGYPYLKKMVLPGNDRAIVFPAYENGNVEIYFSLYF